MNWQKVSTSSIERLLKMHAPSAQPRDPEALTQRILSKIPLVIPMDDRETSLWGKLREEIHSILRPSTLAWGVAAASCVLALVFGIQSFKSTQQLEALLNNQANDKLLFQVAEVAFKNEETKAKAKLELSELLEWNGEMDITQVIDRTGKLPSEQAFKEILQINTTSDKKLK